MNMVLHFIVRVSWQQIALRAICFNQLPWYAKSDDYPTDTTATKNMVTNTASTSMNMVVTPSSTLDLRV